jgi:hypothetical protein
MTKNKKMLYLPLKLSLFYLLAGYLYFLFGPVEYAINNNMELTAYIALYMGAALLGYINGVSIIQKLKFNKLQKLIQCKFWFIVFIVFIADLLFNYSLIKTGEIIPYNVINFFSTVVAGDLDALSGLYYESKIASQTYSGNLLTSVLMFLIGWMRILFIPYVIWRWSNFSNIRRIASVLLIVFPIFSGLSIGLNKPIFDVSLIFFLSCWFIMLIRSYHGEYKEATRLRKLLKKAFIGIAASIILFGIGMNNRGVTFEYIESNSPNGNIQVDSIIPENGISVSMVMLGHYIVQGYYGFSLSLKEPFTSTLGFGHSPFLARQYERVSGIEINNQTYQAKIDSQWAQGTRWHSAFAQFANDVHFIGVSIVIYIAFFMFSITWVSALRYKIMDSIYLLPLHGIFIIFLPANNQVFGFVDSFAMVVIITLAFFVRLVSFK